MKLVKPLVFVHLIFAMVVSCASSHAVRLIRVLGFDACQSFVAVDRSA